jgi:hypothetical protein
VIRAAVVAVLLAGCAPTVLWVGHTADRTHALEVGKEGDRTYVAIDGNRGPRYDGVAVGSIATRDDRVAFAARFGAVWRVVVDRRIGDAWDHVGAIVLGPRGRVAYAADRGGVWHVVVDGVAGYAHEGIRAGALAFDASGAHVAYVAEDHGAVQAVIDGVAGASFAGVGALQFSSDGTHVAYLARRDDDMTVVVDGAAGESWSAIENLMLAGAHAAYVARDGDHARVIVDGVASGAVDRVSQLVVRDDGSQVAWLAKVDNLDVVVADGVPIASWPHDPRSRLAIRPTGEHALAWVRPVDADSVAVVSSDHVGPACSAIGALVWSADGALAYPARRGTTWSLVVGDRELPGGSELGAPVFAAGHLGYVARRKGASIVIVDGREHRFDFAFDDTFVFSNDGARWGVIAGDLAHEQMFIAIGELRVPLSAREIYSIGATRPDSLRTWVVAELARAAR